MRLSDQQIYYGIIRSRFLNKNNKNLKYISFNEIKDIWKISWSKKQTLHLPDCMACLAALLELLLSYRYMASYICKLPLTLTGTCSGKGALPLLGATVSLVSLPLTAETLLLFVAKPRCYINDC